MAVTSHTMVYLSSLHSVECFVFAAARNVVEDTVSAEDPVIRLDMIMNNALNADTTHCVETIRH